MRNVLIFSIGMLLGVGAAAYYFVFVRPEMVAMRVPVAVNAPQPPAPSAAVVPPIVVVPATPPAPAEAPVTAAKQPSPLPASAADDTKTKAPAESPPPLVASAPLPPITPAEPVAVPQPRPQPANVATSAAPGSARPGELIVPVDGVRPSQLSDTYNQRRDGNRPHEALDIMAPRGTPVLAAADGKIVKLFDSKPGGLTIYEFDTTETLAYYYAHLDRYAAGVAAGLHVKQGEVLGYVGSTGNANPIAPHLHFAIFRLGPEKNWWQGTPINPYPLLMAKSGS